MLVPDCKSLANGIETTAGCISILERATWILKRPKKLSSLVKKEEWEGLKEDSKE